MKVILINTLYYPNIFGGAERSVQFLAEELVKKDHEVVVICTCNKVSSQINIVNGVKVYYISLKNLYWPFGDKKHLTLTKFFWHLIDSYNPLMAREINRILELEKPDLVHTNVLAGFSVSVWRVVKSMKLPLVHSIRDYYLLCPKTTMFSKGDNCTEQCKICRLFSIPRCRFSKSVDVVVGISKYILDIHISRGLFPNSKTGVIFNAYNNFIVDRLVDIYDRQQLRLGYIGRLHPSKGIDIILDVLNGLPKNTFTLTIAGRGDADYEKYLKGRSGFNVKYLGFIPPEQLFSQIDVLLVPSLWHEPLGRTVFESYAHGKPVIGSLRGGIPEIIDEGKTGFLFDPENPITLKDAINQFASNRELLEQMRQAVLNKAQLFSPEQIVKSYLSIYKLACEGPSNIAI